MGKHRNNPDNSDKESTHNKSNSLEVLKDEWLDRTAKRAILNKAVTLWDLIFILAEDESYNKVLPKLWDALDLGSEKALSGIKNSSFVIPRVEYKDWKLENFHTASTEVQVTTAEQRTCAWFYVLIRMAKTYFAWQLLLRLPSIPTLPVYFTPKGGLREPPPESPEEWEWLRESGFIKLDDLVSYFHEIEEAYGIKIPVPVRLFPDKKLKDKGKTARKTNQNVFPCEPGTKWEDIKFTLIANDTIKIKAPQGEGKFTYQELGMKDKRNGKPKMIWGLIVLFAKNQGVITNDDLKKFTKIRQAQTTKNTNMTFSDHTKQLNKHLKDLFGINESIFKYHFKKKKRYETKIIFSDQTQVAR